MRKTTQPQSIIDARRLKIDNFVANAALVVTIGLGLVMVATTSETGFKERAILGAALLVSLSIYLIFASRAWRTIGRYYGDDARRER